MTPQAQIEPMQLAFDFDAPVIDIRTKIEAARIARGLSQKQVANVLGNEAAPRYSNAVVRRHDPLGDFARRRALERLKAA